MKHLWFILPLLYTYSCEDNTKDKERTDSELVGTWVMASQAKYENSDCTGELQKSTKDSDIIFELTNPEIKYEFYYGGTGSLTIKTDLETVVDDSITWYEQKSLICPDNFEGIENTDLCDSYIFNADSTGIMINNKRDSYCIASSCGKKFVEILNIIFGDIQWTAGTGATGEDQLKILVGTALFPYLVLTYYLCELQLINMDMDKSTCQDDGNIWVASRCDKEVFEKRIK
tara:strand:- start:260 stop:949 length:690 start_codon:yes stop_codon:yes gene_type:complete